MLVLPVRIELTTSPLPRECSTTELRQRTEAAFVYLDADMVAIASNGWVNRLPGFLPERGARRACLGRVSEGLKGRVPKEKVLSKE